MRLSKSLLVLSVLFIFICLFFGEQIFNQATIGYSYVPGDHLYPYAGEKDLYKGQIVLWNPYLCFGVPLLGFQDSGIFYPWNALYSIFSFSGGVVVFTVFHMLLGGFFCYLFARRINISGFGALTSATIFMLCGFNLVFILMHHDMSHAIIAYIPAVFLMVYNIVKNPANLFYRIALTALIALQVLTGSLTYIIIELIGLMPFLYFLLFNEYKETKEIRKVFSVFLIVSVFIGLGLLLNSFNLLPFKEFIGNSARKYGYSNQYRQQNELVRLSDIFFFAFNPTYEIKYSNVPGAISPFNFFYLGIAPPVLYLFSFFSRNRLKPFFCIILPVISLVFVCGYYVPFFGLVNYIPVLKNIRLFLRFYVLFIFALAVCSGFGLDFLQGKKAQDFESKKKLFAGICVGINILLIIFYYNIPFLQKTFSKINF